MIENVASIGLTSSNNLQTLQHQYPIHKANDEDVLKFNLELNAGDKTPPIFETTEKVKAVPETNKSIFDFVASMDKSYHNAYSTMQTTSADLRAFRTTPKEDGLAKGVSVRTEFEPDLLNNDPVRTPEDVNSSTANQYRQLLSEMKENQTNTLKMMNDMSDWAMQVRTFSSNMKVIGAAVGQINQGFKTLFTSSG